MWADGPASPSDLSLHSQGQSKACGCAKPRAEQLQLARGAHSLPPQQVHPHTLLCKTVWATGSLQLRRVPLQAQGEACSQREARKPAHCLPGPTLGALSVEQSFPHPLPSPENIPEPLAPMPGLCLSLTRGRSFLSTSGGTHCSLALWLGSSEPTCKGGPVLSVGVRTRGTKASSTPGTPPAPKAAGRAGRVLMACVFLKERTWSFFCKRIGLGTLGSCSCALCFTHRKSVTKPSKLESQAAPRLRPPTGTALGAVHPSMGHPLSVAKDRPQEGAKGVGAGLGCGWPLRRKARPP